MGSVVKNAEVLDHVWSTRLTNFSSDAFCLDFYTSVLRDFETVPEGLFLDSCPTTLETIESREKRFLQWVKSYESGCQKEIQVRKARWVKKKA